MNRIRITGGFLKGRGIEISKNGDARYTSGKAREAIFNMMGDIKGFKVLDLFAGSGSFTIEAISRGAAWATCVEKERRMTSIINHNLAGLDIDIDKDCLVLNMDVKYAIPFLYKKVYKYDIIFMDPPYERGFISETMQLLKNNIVYDKNTILILEYSKREVIDPEVFNGWQEVTTKRYGDTCISIYRTGHDAFKN